MGQRAVEGSEGHREGAKAVGGHRAVERVDGSREGTVFQDSSVNLFIAINASRLSRLSLKFSFSRNNDNRKIFREKR